MSTALAILLLACDADSVATTGPRSLMTASDTVNVRDFGARGDGRADDSRAFRRALAALGPSGGTIFVPAGTYVLNPQQGVPDRSLDLSGRSNITIAGEGIKRSTLRMAAGSYRGDTHLVFLQEARRITIQELSLDGNRGEASFSSEQNHCVQVRASSDIHFEKVHFHNCRGDGIMLVAPSSSWTERVSIVHSQFEDNGRSGVAISRAVRNLRILNNTFDRISDQSIDMEPTGAKAPTDILIQGNVIRHTTRAWAVAIGGIKPKDVARRVTFRNNRVENGAVLFGKVDDLTVEGNIILGDAGHGALRLARLTNAKVLDNQISGPGGGDDGLVQIVSVTTSYPARVILRNNRIRPTQGQTGVYVRDALGDITIVENEIQGKRNSTGILIETIAVTESPRSRFSVLNNVLSNFEKGIAFRTRGDAFANVSIQENRIDHDQKTPTETVGIIFEKTGDYKAFAVVRSNTYGRGIKTRVLVR